MGAEYPDTQLQGFHTHPGCDIRQYTIDQLTTYWATIYTLSLIAGLVGTDDEKKAARGPTKG